MVRQCLKSGLSSKKLIWIRQRLTAKFLLCVVNNKTSQSLYQLPLLSQIFSSLSSRYSRTPQERVVRNESYRCSLQLRQMGLPLRLLRQLRARNHPKWDLSCTKFLKPTQTIIVYNQTANRGTTRWTVCSSKCRTDEESRWETPSRLMVIRMPLNSSTRQGMALHCLASGLITTRQTEEPLKVSGQIILAASTTPTRSRLHSLLAQEQLKPSFSTRNRSASVIKCFKWDLAKPRREVNI